MPEAEIAIVGGSIAGLSTAVACGAGAHVIEAENAFRLLGAG